VNALAAAEELIVPIQCEYYALEGLGQLLRNVRLVQQNVNTGLRLTGIVMTMFDPRTKLSEQVVEEVRRYFGERVYQTVIPRTVRLSEAPGFGKPITVYDPSSRGAASYRDLAREVAARLPDETPLPVMDEAPGPAEPPQAQPARAPRPLVREVEEHPQAEEAPPEEVAIEVPTTSTSPPDTELTAEEEPRSTDPSGEETVEVQGALEEIALPGARAVAVDDESAVEAESPPPEPEVSGEHWGEWDTQPAVEDAADGDGLDDREPDLPTSDGSFPRGDEAGSAPEIEPGADAPRKRRGLFRRGGGR
jgi:hypothetical protein